MLDELVWGGVRMMKSDELGGIFVSKELVRNFGKVTLGKMVWESLKI